MDLLDIIALGDPAQHTMGFTDRTGKFAYKKMEGAITPDKLARHIDGTQPLGMYLVTDKRSRCLIFDFDDHDKKGIAKRPTMSVALELERAGVPHVIFRSGGGHGYHIWMFFEEAMLQRYLMGFAKDTLASVDVDGEKFVATASGDLKRSKFNTRGKLTHIEHGVEVLPKGDGLQNIAVPCSRKSIPMRIVKKGGYASLEECSLDDLLIEFVPVMTREADPEEVDENRDTAFDFYIQNFDVDDYGKWGAAGLGLVAAFGKDSEWAKQRWLDWTQTSSKYRAEDDDQWDKLKPKKYSKMSFWRIAARNGYKGPWPGKRSVGDFNDKWALMNVAGGVEFLEVETGNVSNKQSFEILTAPDEEVRNNWLRSPKRKQYNGYTFADPEYVGDKWNLFNGWYAEPTEGDASLFEKYVVEMLCDNDKELAHWVMTFIADAVQRPWSPRPTTGLAIRGPQGSGKSFLGKCVAACLGEHAVEITNSDRVTQQFNDMLVGKTVLLCEEAFFTGSAKQANILKNLLTANNWTFEPKGRKSFSTPNIFRIIATTNNSHAVSLDSDDRRWTIIESESKCPYPPTTRGAIDWWQPFYDLVNEQPGAILNYLLNYEVDRKLIVTPYATAAKAEDKESSDPLLQVLIQMVETGACPDDLRGDGRVASGALFDAVKDRGGRWISAQELSTTVRKKYGAKSSGPNCIKVVKSHVRTDSGVTTKMLERRTDVHGLRMPPIDVLRARLSNIVGRTLSGPDQWVEWSPPTLIDDERAVSDGGRVLKEDDNF